MIKTIKEFFFGKAPAMWFPDEREYIVSECEGMKSCVGMGIKGKPKAGNTSIVSRDQEYRTLSILKIEDFTEGFFAYTKNLTIKFLEV